jgi:hypothetical protein
MSGSRIYQRNWDFLEMWFRLIPGFIEKVWISWNCGFYQRSLEFLEMWFDFKFSLFKIFDVLSFKECAVTFNGLIRIVEANGLKMDDDDELYNR